MLNNSNVPKPKPRPKPRPRKDQPSSISSDYSYIDPLLPSQYPVPIKPPADMYSQPQTGSLLTETPSYFSPTGQVDSTSSLYISPTGAATASPPYISPTAAIDDRSHSLISPNSKIDDTSPSFVSSTDAIDYGSLYVTPNDSVSQCYVPTRDLTSHYPNYQSDDQYQTPHEQHSFVHVDNFPSAGFYNQHPHYSIEQGIESRQNFMSRQDFQQSMPPTSPIKSPSYSELQSRFPTRHIPFDPYLQTKPLSPYRYESTSSLENVNLHKNYANQPFHAPHNFEQYKQPSPPDSISTVDMYRNQNKIRQTHQEDYQSLSTEAMYAGDMTSESKLQKYRSNICNLTALRRSKEEKRPIVMKLLHACGQMNIASRYKRLPMVQILRENEVCFVLLEIFTMFFGKQIQVN